MQCHSEWVYHLLCSFDGSEKRFVMRTVTSLVCQSAFVAADVTLPHPAPPLLLLLLLLLVLQAMVSADCWAGTYWGALW
jgi:hypothetical protein